MGESQGFVNAARILIIDDDSDMVALLRTTFQREGYQVSVALDGERGLAALSEVEADLVVLDLDLPGMDGWEVVRSIRLRLQVPVIMLTAMQGSGLLVRGLDSGADDFLNKPFEREELLARVKAKLRRGNSVGTTALFDDGRLRIDVQGLVVTVKDREALLSSAELRLLVYLFLHADRTCSYSELREHVLGLDGVAGEAAIHGCVHRVRRKLARLGLKGTYVITERGLGYRFVG